MNKIDELLVFLENSTKYKFIYAFQGKAPPKPPYCSVQILDSDIDNRHILKSRRVENLMIEEKGFFRVQEALQINVIADSQQESLKIAKLILDNVFFINREQIYGELEIGILKTSTIKNISEVKNSIFIDHTHSFDMIVDYTKQIIRNIENANAVIANGVKVSRASDYIYELTGEHNHSGIIDLQLKK